MPQELIQEPPCFLHTRPKLDLNSTLYMGRLDSPSLEETHIRSLPPPPPNPHQSPPPPPHPPPAQAQSYSKSKRRGGHRLRKPSLGVAFLVHHLGDNKRPDIAEEASRNPPLDDSDSEQGSQTPPEMTTAIKSYPIHDGHPFRSMSYSASMTRPHSGGSTAPLDFIMNSEGNQMGHSAPRLDTSQQALATSSVAQHLLSAPMRSASTSSPSTATISPGNAPTLPSLKEIALKEMAGPLPPPTHHHFTPSGLPSPASDLASSRPQLPPLGKQPAVTTPPLSYRSHPSPPSSARSPLQGPLSAVSPRNHFAAVQSIHSKPLSPQSDAATPAVPFSASSYQSSNGALPLGGDAMQVDSARPVLPPLGAPPNLCAPGTIFRCKHAGCTAPPFQTQYLLNSHMNVHSSSRPHYCPIKGCPRAEGGRGFKRKNEMIRHGLVHQSPGYACPFCPDREHKYPRPDNLQRHVKGHHVDKEKDDPVLREVLNQRLDGGSRGRRRRANS